MDVRFERRVIAEPLSNERHGVEGVDGLVLRSCVGAGDHLEVLAVAVVDPGVRGDRLDLSPEQELDEVDLVRAQVLDHAAQAVGGLEAMVRAPLAAPVLQEDRRALEVAGGAEQETVLDEAPGLERPGRTLVAERHHGGGARLLGLARHLLRLPEGRAEGLFADHGLAGPQGRDRHAVMLAVRGGDDHHVGLADLRLPIGRHPLEAVAGLGLRQPLGVPAGDAGQDELDASRPQLLVCFEDGTGMGDAAHEALADDEDLCFLHAEAPRP